MYGSITNKLIVIVGALIVACFGCSSDDKSSGSTSTDPTNPPVIVWAKMPGQTPQIDVVEHYDDDEDVTFSYTAYIRLRNEGGSGEVLFIAELIDYGKVVRPKSFSFNLTNGGEYTLVIHGGGGATDTTDPNINQFDGEIKLRVKSSQAESDWETILLNSGYYERVKPYNIGTTVLEIGLINP